MLIIAGHIEVDPPARTRYLDGCVTVVEQARRAPGCADISITGDLLESGRINIYELWESDADLDAFRASVRDADPPAPILAADVHRYRISAVEAP